MKKVLAILALAAAMSLAQAQSMETLWHNFGHQKEGWVVGPYRIHCITGKPDGNIVADVSFIGAERWNIENVGNGFYTISPETATIMDSTFLEANLIWAEDFSGSSLLEHDSNNGYIYARFAKNRVTYPGWSGKTWLEIVHFDENLCFQGDSTIVTLEDSWVEEDTRAIMLEDHEHLLLRYVVDGVLVLSRIGLDGTVEDKKPMPELFQGPEWKINGMVTYTDTPREYAVYGWDTAPNGDTVFLFHVLDSLFNLQETVVMENQSGHYHYFDNMLSLLPYDAQTYYVISKYTKDNEPLNGLRITKYDKESHEELAEILIRSGVVYQNLDLCAFPVGFGKSGDGNLYLAYRTCNNPHRGYIKGVKLSADLEIIWERACVVMEEFVEYHGYHTLFQSDRFVIGVHRDWSGSVYQGDNKNHFAFFFLHDDGTISTPEAEAFVRSYTYYPNPVQNELHLQYSPDVQPKEIGLYDVQGRLVLTQNKNLENINLQNLGAGQYLMKVTLEDGKVFTDKILKE